MAGFDLSRFRERAFGRTPLPNHPLRDERSVNKMIEGLPQDPIEGLAELTHWVMSVNSDDEFSAERRARVLMALEQASRSYWSALSVLYLAPEGKPVEGRQGDASILRGMLDSALGFSTGYGFSLLREDKTSRWSEENVADVALRSARWIGRRYTLSHMLNLPVIDDIWEDLHNLYLLADAHQVLRKVIAVYPDATPTSSVKQAYTRVLLTDLCGLESLRGREVELAFRIAGRVASSAKLESEPMEGATCAVQVQGASRPTAVRRLPASAKSVLYLDAFNCLPRLKSLLERDMDADLAGPDSMFGPGFTLRERNAMISRLMDAWGPTPPQRRSKRVPLSTVALVRGGFDSSAEVIATLEQGGWRRGPGEESRLQIVYGEAEPVASPKVVRKSQAEAKARLVDASVGGLGLVVPRKQAAWARLGLLMAVYIEPGPAWVIGVVRRVSAEEEMLSLGIAVFARQPKLAWFRLETTGYTSVWEEEKRHDRNFLEHFQRGILVDADSGPLAPGELLIAPGVAERGSRLDVPFPTGVQRIRVTAVREATEDFQRVAFESLGMMPPTA